MSEVVPPKIESILPQKSFPDGGPLYEYIESVFFHDALSELYRKSILLQLVQDWYQRKENEISQQQAEDLSKAIHDAFDTRP